MLLICTIYDGGHKFSIAYSFIYLPFLSVFLPLLETSIANHKRAQVEYSTLRAPKPNLKYSPYHHSLCFIQDCSREDC